MKYPFENILKRTIFISTYLLIILSIIARISKNDIEFIFVGKMHQFKIVLWYLEDWELRALRFDHFVAEPRLFACM